MSWLLSLRTIAVHVAVVVVVAACVALGLWQLDRLGERRALNARIEEGTAAAPVDVGRALAGLELGDPSLERLEYRPVTATGEFRTADEVLQRGRALQGRSGYHVLTPLDLDTGGTVLVRRGWVPFALDTPPITDALPPAGTVTVTGWLQGSTPQPEGGIVQRDPAQGRLDQVFHADLGRLDEQLSGPGGLLPMLVALETVDPTTPGQLPVPPERPPLDDGPHLPYAVQWFSFAAVALGFHVTWLVRRRRAYHDQAGAATSEPASPRGASR